MMSCAWNQICLSLGVILQTGPAGLLCLSSKYSLIATFLMYRRRPDSKISVSVLPDECRPLTILLQKNDDENPCNFLSCCA